MQSIKFLLPPNSDNPQTKIAAKTKQKSLKLARTIAKGLQRKLCSEIGWLG